MASGGSYPPNYADPGVATAATTPGPTGTSPGQSPYGGVDWSPWANEITGMLGSQLAGQQASTTAQQTWLGQQEQQLGIEQAFQTRELGQQYGYQQQQFGVQGQQLGLQGTELAQQQAHLGAQYGFQQQENVLTGQDIAANIQNILAGYGFQKQQFGVQQGQLNLAEQQGAQSQAAGGLATSGGAKGQMQTGFGLQQQGLNIAEAQAAQQEKYAMFGQQQAQKQLGLTEAQQKEQFGYSTQQIQDGMRQLNLQQQSLGISEAQANTQYQNALQQTGLSGTMSVDQLKQQMAAIAGGGYSPIMSMMGQFVGLLPFLGGMFTNPQTGQMGGK